MNSPSLYDMRLIPIGVIHSPFLTREEAPRQGIHSNEVSILEIHDDLQAAVKGIEKHTHIIVLYWADRADRYVLTSHRHEQSGEVRGVFATRSPARPNPISMCVCELVKVEGLKLEVRGLDALDGSPLLDLKPHFAEIDHPNAR